MTKNEKLLIATSMNVLEVVSDSLAYVPKAFGVRCLLDDEILVQLRDILLDGVEDEWRSRARKAVKKVAR